MKLTKTPSLTHNGVMHTTEYVLYGQGNKQAERAV